MSEDRVDTGLATPAMPDLRVRWRGYDRGQVDDYVRQLRRFLADAEARAAEAYRLLRAGQARDVP